MSHWPSLATWVGFTLPQLAQIDLPVLTCRETPNKLTNKQTSLAVGAHSEVCTLDNHSIFSVSLFHWLTFQCSWSFKRDARDRQFFPWNVWLLQHSRAWRGEHRSAPTLARLLQVHFWGSVSASYVPCRHLVAVFGKCEPDAVCCVTNLVTMWSMVSFVVCCSQRLLNQVFHWWPLLVCKRLQHLRLICLYLKR